MYLFRVYLELPNEARVVQQKTEAVQTFLPKLSHTVAENFN